MEGEAASPTGRRKEETVSDPPATEAEPVPVPSGTGEGIRRFDVTCQAGQNSLSVRVAFDVASPARALLEACRRRSKYSGLSRLREHDGITLDLDEPVGTKSLTGFAASWPMWPKARRAPPPLPQGMRFPKKRRVGAPLPATPGCWSPR